MRENVPRQRTMKAAMARKRSAVYPSRDEVRRTMGGAAAAVSNAPSNGTMIASDGN
jgi:hypothetical protein